MIKPRHLPRKTYAPVISLLLFLTLGSAQANEAGWVSRISGLLSAKAIDGKLRVLSLKSKVFAGDVISTEKDSFARIRLNDGGRLVLRPETTITIESYHYAESRPKKDMAVINLLKGGMRTITGAIGKRGNQDAYQTKTPLSTIGIRGTVYGLLLCNGDSCGGIPESQRPDTDGLYVNVVSGAIKVTNTAGVQDMSAGQFGHLATATSAVKLLQRPPKGLDIKAPKHFQNKAPKTPKAAVKEAMECKI